MALELRREAIPRRRPVVVRALQLGARPRVVVLVGPSEDDHAPGVVTGGQELAAAVELDGRDFIRCGARAIKAPISSTTNTRRQSARIDTYRHAGTRPGRCGGRP